MTAFPWEEIISVGQLLDLYREGMRRGGMAAPPKEGCVEGCLGNAWTAEEYRQEEGLRIGLLFAAYLMVYLVKDHCFPDGNKRIAWSAMMYVLARRGLTVDATDEDAVNLVLSVAQGEAHVDNVVRWLSERLVSLN